MHSSSIAPLLKEKGLRDTQPRRLVIRSLAAMHAASPHDIAKWIATQGDTVNPVTIYRILALLEKLHLVHRHPDSGHYFLCSIPKKHGHHGFLQCIHCRRIEEFRDDALASQEASIAIKAGFQPTSYLTSILGICMKCSV